MGLAASDRYKKNRIQLQVLEDDLARGKSDGKSPQGITSLYRNQGYWFFSYQIIERIVDEKQAAIQVVITEGPQMKVGRITVEGKASVAPDDIRKLTGIASGEIFNEFKVISSFGSLQKTGKIKGNTQVTPRLNPNTRAIDITYTFSEN